MKRTSIYSKFVAAATLAVLLVSITQSLAYGIRYCKHDPAELVVNPPPQPGSTDCTSRSSPNCRGDACGIFVSRWHCVVGSTVGCDDSSCSGYEYLGDAHCKSGTVSYSADSCVCN